MDAMLRDLRYAFRSLVREPGFAAAAVLCLALGIGVNAVMFGVVDTLLFRPPAHVRDSGRIVRAYFTETYSSGPNTSTEVSFPKYVSLRDGVPGFASIAAFWSDSLAVRHGVEVEKVSASLVSHSYFSLLGVAPALGRFFGAAEDRAGGAPVAVLGEGFWRERFGGDPLAVGRPIRIGTSVYTVVGVAPRGFRGPDLRPIDVWLPVSVAAPEQFDRDVLSSPDNVWISVLARLAPGTSVEQASSQATVAYRRAGASPAERSGVVSLGPIQAARGPEMSQGGRVSSWLAAMAGIVLLIACANVANLLVVRSMRRKRETAVRLALGAGRARLVRQLVTESLLLSVLGGAAALLLALWCGPLIRGFMLPAEVAPESVLDVRVLGFTTFVAVLTGVLVGVLPALRASRPDLATALKAGEGERRYQRSGLRAALLIGQVALAVVLTVGAGLFVRSLRNVLRIDLGLDARRLLVVSLDVGSGTGPAEVGQAYWRMLERARSIPGIAEAAGAVGGPFSGGTFGARISVPGLGQLPAPAKGRVFYNSVTPEFFAATGTRVLRGRGLTSGDAAASRVAVIGETMARLLWPGQDALGKCFSFGRDSACVQVVGIAADAHRQGVVEEPDLQFYTPLVRGSGPAAPLVLYLRASAEARAMAETVRRTLQRESAGDAYVRVRSIRDLVEPQLAPWRFGATVFGLFGALALVLAALGLYTVLAYAVSQRTREIGVRMALGADPGDVFRLVVGQGLRIVAVGLGLGLLLAVAVGRVAASRLYGVSPHDPLVLMVAASVLLAVAAAASYLPARRAARVEPVVALGAE